MPCPTLLVSTLSCSTIPYLPHHTLAYPTLPFPALPYPTLIFFTLPYPTLPYRGPRSRGPRTRKPRTREPRTRGQEPVNHGPIQPSDGFLRNDDRGTQFPCRVVLPIRSMSRIQFAQSNLPFLFIVDFSPMRVHQPSAPLNRRLLSRRIMAPLTSDTD